MLRGRALTARVKSREEGIHKEKVKCATTPLEDVDVCVCVCVRRWAGLTCHVDIGWGGVQGRGSPCSAAVAGSDACGRREHVSL